MTNSLKSLLIMLTFTSSMVLAYENTKPIICGESLDYVSIAVNCSTPSEIIDSYKNDGATVEICPLGKNIVVIGTLPDGIKAALIVEPLTKEEAYRCFLRH